MIQIHVHRQLQFYRKTDTIIALVANSASGADMFLSLVTRNWPGTVVHVSDIYG